MSTLLRCFFGNHVFKTKLYVYSQEKISVCVAHKENLGRSSEAIPHRLLFGVFPFFGSNVIFIFYLFDCFFICHFLFVLEVIDQHIGVLATVCKPMQTLPVPSSCFIKDSFPSSPTFSPRRIPHIYRLMIFFTIFRAVNTALKFSK